MGAARPAPPPTKSCLGAPAHARSPPSHAVATGARGAGALLAAVAVLKRATSRSRRTRLMVALPARPAHRPRRAAPHRARSTVPATTVGGAGARPPAAAAPRAAATSPPRTRLMEGYHARPARSHSRAAPRRARSTAPVPSLVGAHAQQLAAAARSRGRSQSPNQHCTAERRATLIQMKHSHATPTLALAMVT